MQRIAPDEAASSASLELARWLTPQALIPLIKGEHPQALAVLLVQLDPEVAAQVLQSLPADAQTQVVHRIATLGPVSPEALGMLDELLARRIGENPALGRHKAADISPTPADLRDDQSIDAWVRQGANTIFHPVGTARMGSDAASVVDRELRVRGVRGLRVADASVMPLIVGGNTSAPTMMIAEKAADMILGRAAPPRADPRQDR